ncbi:GATA transcription factor [Rhynchospora pubera]|uniref:GATA transcription factor n=1 Tax=Rhynchospora pubera TaxID=906938 RepID=A0AAV8CVR3_9POAL|nr:GATA transcription factor [Rhynchospora pubera]
MLHQTLISSSLSPTFSSPSHLSKPLSSFLLPLSLSSSSSLSPQATKETATATDMEPFKNVFMHQQSEEGVFVGERGNNTLFGAAGGEAFSVEELLDLGGFSDQLETSHERKELEKEKSKAREVKRESSDDSGVTFDLPLPPSVIDLPAHDAEELEWVSLIMDDSLSEVPATCTALPPRVPVKQEVCETKLRPTLYPPRVPVKLEDYETKLKPTLCALSTESLVPVKARRSKRSRAAVWSLSGSDNSSSSSSTTSSCSSSSFLFYDSPFITSADAPAFLLDDSVGPPAKKQKPKKRGRKPKVKNYIHPLYYTSSGSERRCSHCGVNKTPQWRAGPEGAKTLCNACGVRYKSGRLLPEYRPACSPTFVSELHSNSHRKVLEMRRKKESTMVEVSAPAVASF